jgi:uncharacterized surface protein with fasciclin (FAS1) repeats
MKKGPLRKLFFGMFIMIFATALSAADAYGQDYEREYESNNIVDVINASTDHTILAQLLAEAQLIETLNMEGPYTVLAPTDAAFYELGTALNEVRQDPQQLQAVLLQHLFQGEVPSEDVTEAIGIEIDNGDIEADNGVIHVIETVILPN